MEVRDAVEGDTEAIAGLIDGPREFLRNLIHDRTVRVATEDDDIIGFVSYDARPGTVYVTQLGGDATAVARLLEEPVRFAEHEAMTVELLIAESDTDIQTVVDEAGFEEIGAGPQFDGVPTRRYEIDPTGSA